MLRALTILGLIASALAAQAAEPAKEAAKGRAVPSPCAPSPPMREHLLYLLYLTSPPGAPKPIWSLQTSSSSSFASCEACAAAALAIQASITRTPTITLVGWCFARDISTPGTGGVNFDALSQILKLPKDQQQGAFDLFRQSQGKPPEAENPDLGKLPVQNHLNFRF